eukprot:5798215-Pleurochrysis_carterae.AAC.1
MAKCCASPDFSLVHPRLRAATHDSTTTRGREAAQCPWGGAESCNKGNRATAYSYCPARARSLSLPLLLSALVHLWVIRDQGNAIHSAGGLAR